MRAILVHFQSCHRPREKLVSAPSRCRGQAPLRIVGWARSSAVEHRLHTAGVTGSIPVAPTIRPIEKIRYSADFCDGAQFADRTCVAGRCRNMPGICARIKTKGRAVGSAHVRGRVVPPVAPDPAARRQHVRSGYQSVGGRTGRSKKPSDPLLRVLGTGITMTAQSPAAAGFLLARPAVRSSATQCPRGVGDCRRSTRHIPTGLLPVGVKIATVHI